MKKYKAIICDLDGTLLNNNHTISEFTKETIKKVVEKGIKFYIATGRHHMDALEFKNILNLNSFLISSNGARVHNENNEEIFSINIPKNVTTELINLDIDDEIHKNIYMGDSWISEKPLPQAKAFHRDSGFMQTVIPSFDALRNKESIKFFFMGPTEEKIAILNKEIEKKMGNHVAITLSMKDCLEVMCKGVSKGEAIKKMLGLEGIALSEAIAFGDGMNDVEMLGVVDKGFLMGNHNPSLKEALPDNEIIGTNHEDAVAHKLIELFL
ncbi:MAG: Cof-type HAD-IIB family hydrolase [Fusobacteriaceae bacterium]